MTFSPPGALVDCRTHDAPRVARGRPRRGRHGPDVRQPARRSRAPCSSACPGFTRDGHDFAPDAVARGAAALVVAAAAGARRARGGRGRRAGGDGASPPRASTAIRRRRCGSPGSPAPTARRRPRSSTRALLEGAGLSCGLLGTVKSVVGGEEHAVVRTTPEAIDLQRTFREMLDARRRRVRDGDLLARAGAARARTGSTSPRRCSPTSRRTTSTSIRRWRTTSRPSGCCSRRALTRRADRQRRRRLRAAADRGVRLR